MGVLAAAAAFEGGESEWHLFRFNRLGFSLHQPIIRNYNHCTAARHPQPPATAFDALCHLFQLQSLIMNKLTQAEIDQLARDSDQDPTPHQDQYQQEFEENDAEEQYGEDAEMNEQIAQEEPQGEYKIEDEPEVESEIASENMDEVASEQMGNGSQFQFKKDEDLSEAQSEFIESSRLNDAAILKVKSNIRSQDSKQTSKLNPNQNRKPKQAEAKPKQAEAKPKQLDSKPKPKAALKPVAKPTSGKQLQQNSQQQSKRQKLSESEVGRRMKQIQQGRREMQRKKQQRQKKEEQLRRKQYEQAKQKEEERKQKNKRIFDQQIAKRKPVSHTKIEIEPQQVKIPQKRSDYKYMGMKKERVQNEKLIQKKIQEQNLHKLKKLHENLPKEVKGEAKKQAILEQRSYQLQREKKQKQKEQREQDVLIIKQIKQEIMQSKRFNLEKNQDINRAEKNIQALNKKIKEKEKIVYQLDSKTDAVKQEETYDDLSELSPIEKFVFSFPEAKTVDEIFRTIDENGDGVLSTAQIHSKLTEFGLSKEIIDRVEQVLDENSDGSVSHEQFVFIVELEVKRQKDYRQILGDVDAASPIDLQARIIDMQAKLKYISKQIESHSNNHQEEAYDAKLQALARKAHKIQGKIRKQTAEAGEEGRKDVSVNSIANLANQFVRLRNDKAIRLSFLEKLRRRVKENLAQKNGLLGSRVQQSLRLQQQIYKIKNQIQQRELRFLSVRKIEENKRGYVQRQTQKRKQMEQAYKRTKEYQILIADPGRKAQKNAAADQMRFLAAVLMIQRNYRKRKARGEFEKLKQERKQ